MTQDYPTTTTYLTYLAEAVFSGVKTARDNTVISLPGMGIQAYILSMINTRKLPFEPRDILIDQLGPDLSKNVIYIPINLEILEEDNLLEQFHFCLNNNPNLEGSFAKPESVLDLSKTVAKLMQKHTFIIILSTVPTPEDLDQATFKALRYIQSINNNNFRIIFSFNRINEQNDDISYRAYLKKVTYIKPFTVADIEHQTVRLFKRFSHNAPSASLIKNIFDYSCGLGSFVKYYILQSVDNKELPESYGDYEQKYLEQIFSLLTTQEKLELINLDADKIAADSYLNRSYLLKMPKVVNYLKDKIRGDNKLEKLSANFTRTEWHILQYFLAHNEEVVTREQIAEQIWGGQSSEKYSDWTIDKHIANIRSKAKSLGTIKTLKTRGFQFIRNQEIIF